MLALMICTQRASRARRIVGGGETNNIGTPKASSPPPVFWGVAAPTCTTGSGLMTGEFHVQSPHNRRQISACLHSITNIFVRQCI